MSEEIKKEAKDAELNKEDLDIVAGGEGYNCWEDGQRDHGKGITFNTLEEAKFYASGLCPRCGKIFEVKSDILDHIKAWASGQK